MTVGATTSRAFPKDQQAWAASVESLRRKRRFSEARTLLDEQDLRPFKHEPARAALVTSARIHTEYANYAAAELAYRAAADRKPKRRTDPDPKNPEDIWLVAEAEVCSYLHHAGRSDVVADVAADLRAVQERLEGYRQSRIAHWARAPFEWALGVIKAGAHPDDDPQADAINEARALLDLSKDALRGEYAAQGRSRVARAQARLAWVAARAASDRKLGISRARDELQRLREEAEDSLVLLTIEYYEARVDMLARHFKRAGKRFDAILKGDGGHQAALVWRLYCRRVETGDSPHLLDELNALLPSSLDEPFEPAPHDAPPRVFDRNLVAELLTERAAIAEDRKPADAVRDYERALEVRPRMVYAQRRRLEALVELGDLSCAKECAEKYVDEYQTWSDETRVRMPHALLVDVGIVDCARKDYDAALDRFRMAIELMPNYGFAYEARFAAERLNIPVDLSPDARREQLGKLIADAEALLASDNPRLAGTGGLTVEIGQACFARGDEHNAVEHLTQALADGSGIVRDRARAALIDIHRLTRRFDAAERYASEAGDDVGPRTRAAAAWVYAEYGDLQGALDCFEKALEQKPRNPAFITAHARTLRLLGRLTEAKRKLEVAEVASHRLAMVENERAWTLLDLGEHREAGRAFADIVRREPAYEAAVRGLIAALSHQEATWREIERVSEDARTALGGDRAAVVAETALARIRRREFREARELVDRACELALDDHVRVTLRLLAANELFVARAYPDVQATLRVLHEATVADAAEDPRIAMLEARVLTAIEDYDGGMERFRRLEDEWPRSFLALMGQAFIHYQCGRYGDAQRCLEHLLTISPDNVATLERLAWTLVGAHESDSELGGLVPPDRHDDPKASRLRRAEDLCERVRQIEPTRTSVLNCLATIAVMRGLAPAADLYLAEAGRQRVPALETLHNRGAVCMRLGRYTEAVTTLEQAVKHRDADTPTRTLLGTAYLEADRLPEAAIELKRATAGDPRDPQAAVALVTALDRLHRSDEARDTIAQALRVVPHREQLPLLLVRAHLLHAQAVDKSRREAAVLIDEALLDVCTSRRIATRNLEIADVEYHRGVLLHARGSRKAASQAFREACRLNPAHSEARRAGELIAAAAHDDPERATRRWSIVLAIAAIVLIIGAIVLGLAKAGWDPIALDLVTLNWTVGMLLVLLIVAATLPRLTGMEFGKQVKLSLDAAAPSEPMSVTLSFRRLPPVPPRLMGGPSPYGQYETPSDTEGVDN
jgi:tetratricopeptide (TPR) repeat protein